MTASEGKNSDSSDSKKHLLFLCFDFFSRSEDSLGFFSFAPPSLFVVVNFICTTKSN